MDIERKEIEIPELHIGDEEEPTDKKKNFFTELGKFFGKGMFGKWEFRFTWKF